jgi:hypothetical protein
MEHKKLNTQETANSDLGAVSGMLPDEVPNLFVTLAQQIHYESAINGLDMTGITECFNELQEAYKKAEKKIADKTKDSHYYGGGYIGEALYGSF